MNIFWKDTWFLPVQTYWQIAVLFEKGLYERILLFSEPQCEHLLRPVKTYGIKFV